MKEVLAVIRMNMMNATKLALADAGVSAFNARPAFGRGKGKVDFRILDGAAAGHDEAISQLGPQVRLIPKRMVSMVVPNAKVQTVVDAVIKVNCTRHPGDGKIFVMPCEDAIRIRTGECGDVALDEVI